MYEYMFKIISEYLQWEHFFWQFLTEVYEFQPPPKLVYYFSPSDKKENDQDLQKD